MGDIVQYISLNPIINIQHYILESIDIKLKTKNSVKGMFEIQSV